MVVSTRKSRVLNLKKDGEKHERAVKLDIEGSN